MIQFSFPRRTLGFTHNPSHSQCKKERHHTAGEGVHLSCEPEKSTHTSLIQPIITDHTHTHTHSLIIIYISVMFPSLSLYIYIKPLDKNKHCSPDTRAHTHFHLQTEVREINSQSCTWTERQRERDSSVNVIETQQVVQCSSPPRLTPPQCMLGDLLGGQDEGDDEAVEPEHLGEDEDKDHADEEAWLLCRPPHSCVSHNADGKTSSQSTQSYAQPRPQVQETPTNTHTDSIMGVAVMVPLHCVAYRLLISISLSLCPSLCVCVSHLRSGKSSEMLLAMSTATTRP